MTELFIILGAVALVMIAVFREELQCFITGHVWGEQVRTREVICTCCGKFKLAR